MTKHARANHAGGDDPLPIDDGSASPSPEELEPQNIARSTLFRLVKMQLKIDLLFANLRDMKRTIHGNGEPGLKTTVDRINEWVASRKKLEMVVLSALATMAIGAIWYAVICAQSAGMGSTIKMPR